MPFTYPVPYTPPDEVPPSQDTGSGGRMERQVPSGDINGVNRVFTFTSRPTMIFRNGVNETRFGDITGYVFTFDTAPNTGDEIEGCVYE